MNYIVPTILNIEKKCIDNEVELILKVEYMSGNLVKAIAPFYYPICIENFSYSFSYIVDPYSMKTHRLVYKIPDTILLIKLIKTIDHKHPIRLIKELYGFVKKYRSVDKWLEYSVVFDRVIHSKTLLNNIVSLFKYIIIDDINGVLFKPIDIESIILKNNALFEKAITDINKAILNIDYLKSILIRYRNKVGSRLLSTYEEQTRKWERVYNTVDKIINSNIREINNVLAAEKTRIDRKYNIQINRLNRVLKTIDQSISYNVEKLKSVERELRDSYRRIIGILVKKKKSILKDIELVEKEFRKEILSIERKYSLIKNIENFRRIFLSREKRVLSREYVCSKNLLYLYTDRIINELNNVIDVLEKYRDDIHNLFVPSLVIGEQCVFIRGFVVHGSKNTRVYTPGFLVKRFGYRIDFNKFLRRLLIGNGVVYKLLRIDPYLLNKYNLLKK